MLFGPEREVQVITSSTRELQKFGQHKLHFLNHRRPRVSLNNQARYVTARGDPDICFRVPSSFYADRMAHPGKIVHGSPRVNPLG